MTTDCALGLDLGTSGVKAVLLAADGTVVAEASQGYALRAPRPGRAETDPADWERAARAAIARLRAEAPAVRIVGVGIDGQMHGTVVVDAQGHPVRPAILWPDGRAQAELGLWRRLDPRVQRRLANPLAAGMTGPVLAWLVRQEAETMRRAAGVMLPKDWLRSRLVGHAPVTDPSDASATLLWDMAAGDWDPAVCEQAGIRSELLPRIEASDAVAGQVDARRGRDWDLPADLPVAVGCADVAATVVGLGMSAGRCGLTVGTGAQGIVAGIEPAFDGPIRHHTYRAADGGHYAMAAVLNGGLALARVVTLLGASWEELYRPYDAARPLPRFVPYLAGERLPEPIPPGSAAFTGVGLQTERADLLAAALEGVAFAIGRAVDRLPAVTEPVVEAAGGGTRSAVFAQLIADVLGRPLRIVPVEDVTALGAARLGWRAAGGPEPARPGDGGRIVEPKPHPALTERYRLFVEAAAEAAGGEAAEAAAAER